MADRNRNDWDDDRRGQGSRDWEEGRQRYGEWRAGRGGDEGRGYEGRGYEGRGYEGRGYEDDRGYGRMGREDMGRGRGSGEDMGRGRFGYGGGRSDEDPGASGRMGREDFGRGRGDDMGRYEDIMDSGRVSAGGYQGRGYEGGGYQGRAFDDWDSGRAVDDRSSAPIPRQRYGDAGIGPSPFMGGRAGQRTGGLSGGLGGGMGGGMDRRSEPSLRGRSTYMGGGFGGMEPDMGRDYRPEDYGRGEDSGRGVDVERGGGLRSIGYGLARTGTGLGTGEGERRMGRGPKSYQRSDDRIREDLCERLMQSWMNAENVDVQVRGGEVTLLGTVDSRAEKRAIEDVAESVLGVNEVHNQLRVRRADTGVQATQTSQATGASSTTTGSQTQGTQARGDTGRSGTTPPINPMHS